MEISTLRKEMMKTKRTDIKRSKVLQSILSNALLLAKEDGDREANEEDILSSAKKEIKMAQQSKDSGAPFNELTFSVAEEFLPKVMGKEDLSKIIYDIVSHDSNANIGSVMRFLKNQYTNQYDGKLASQIIKEVL